MIINGALNAAVRWNWISTNTGKTARRPKRKTPPLVPAMAARLVEAAFDVDNDSG